MRDAVSDHPLAPARLGRLAAATTCVAFGLPSDALVVGAALIVTHARVTAVATWQRVHLSWRARSWLPRLAGDGHVGRRVPKSC
jgi:hypothetical protein